MKQSRNKYQLSPRGELMLVHECVECRSLSINRIAADDDPEMILAVFRSSLTANASTFLEQHGIVTLNTDHIEIVHAQLYGRSLVMT